MTGLPVVAGRWVRAHLGRTGRRLAALSIVLLCGGLGASGYLGAGPEVPVEHAESAGLTAGLGLGLVPIGLFYAIGYLVRSARAAATVWMLCVVPAGVFAGSMMLSLAVQQSCTSTGPCAF